MVTSLTVLDSRKAQAKIRLSAIDAPEKAQPFGSRSKQSLSDICFDKVALVDVVNNRSLSPGRVGEAVFQQARKCLVWEGRFNCYNEKIGACAEKNPSPCRYEMHAFPEARTGEERHSCHTRPMVWNLHARQ